MYYIHTYTIDNTTDNISVIFKRYYIHRLLKNKIINDSNRASRFKFQTNFFFP